MEKLVLIINDDYNSAKLVWYTLEAHGYSIVEAYSGKRGVQLV